MDRIIVRSASVRIFFVVFLALIAMAASAHASPEGPSPEAHEVRVAGALFTPTRQDDGLEWRVRWVLTPEAAEDILQGATRAVRFAIPLTAAETLEKTEGVTPITQSGQVVGVLIDRAGLDGRLVTTVVHQHVPRDGRLGVHLGAPVAAGSALQILDGDLGSGARLELDVGRALERHVGYVAPPGVGHAAREEARRLTGYDARLSGAPIYVRGDDVKAVRALVATIETPRGRGRSGAIGVAVAFGALVIALFVAVTRLRHAASVERADAILAAELDGLETHGGGGH